jgi:hypothetical protein
MRDFADIVGAVAAAGIRQWFRMTGRRVARRDTPWLECPMGPPGRIGAEFYTYLAEREQLRLRPSPGAGLLPDFGALRGDRFDPSAVHPAIRDFYEATSRYRLDAWSEAGVPTRLFLWALTRFVSRSMDQMNFPVSSLELAGGMTSEILPMVDGEGRLCRTGWLRRLPSTDRVVYTALYSVGRLPGYPDPCVKVSFPLPHGSTLLFLRPEAQRDGSFKLISSGSRFGDPGVYRLVAAGAEHWRVRYLRGMREVFHVYLDRHGILRTDHEVRCLGLAPLRLSYRMELSRPGDAAFLQRESGTPADRQEA